MRAEAATIHPVEPASTRGRAISVGRLAGWSLVAALVGAGAWAVVLLLSGSLGDTDLRIVLTSLTFAAASTTGASGVAATLRGSWLLRTLGAATIMCSAAAFALVTTAIWKDSLLWYGHVDLWRACGCAVVLAVGGGHASLMLRGWRPTDSALVQLVTVSSLAFGSIDAFGAFLPLAKLVDDFDESWTRTLAAVLVLLILTTVIALLLRRLQVARAPVPGAEHGGDSAEALASDVIRIAERIDLLNGDPGNRAPEIQAEANRLRKLAQSFET